MAKYTPKIQAGAAPKGGGIPTPTVPTGTVLFSFRYVDFSIPELRLDQVSPGYFEQFVAKLIQVSKFTTREFQTDRGICRALHSHSFDFGLCNVPAGYAHINPLALWYGKHWQFSITVNEHGRIFGFFEGDVFYVVWFDPTHHVDPKRK